MSNSQRFIAIDEEGYPLFEEKRVTDPSFAREIFSNLKFDNFGALVSHVNGTPTYIEAFDEPLVARHVTEEGSKLYVSMPFEYKIEFLPQHLSLDQWDRFHGYSLTGIPFVMSRTAQKELFALCDDYDDDSIKIGGREYIIPPWLSSSIDVQQPDFWNEKYRSSQTGWELERPSPALVDILPRLKLPKSRVLVLGSGSGNDAAHFAMEGHRVTAVDFSIEALEKSKKKYAGVGDITWFHSDVFTLPTEFDGAFDIIFEHTCFCAISPEKRDELISIWRRSLAPKGHILAVLFAMEKKQGPPFGGSEWEYRERLKKYFQFIFWGRWRQSLGNRDGKELLIYAQKKEDSAFR